MRFANQILYRRLKTQIQNKLGLKPIAQNEKSQLAELKTQIQNKLGLKQKN